MVPRSSLLLLLLVWGGPASAQRVAVGADNEGVVAGRVLDAETQEAVAGHPVVLRGGGIEAVVVETDADGRFWLLRPAVERGRLVLAAEHAPGWRALGEVRLEDAVGPVTLTVRRTETRPLKGRAVDPSGEPLPFFELKLWEYEGPFEDLTTDVDGRFTTTVPFAATRMFAYPSENGARGDPVRFQNTHGRGEDEVELRFAAGEELALRFTPPPGTTLDDFVAVGLTSAEHLAQRRSKGARLRSGTLPWVRFSKERDFRRGVHELHVCSEDGLWGARVQGPLGEVADVRLERLGVLHLTLHPGAGLLARTAEGERRPRALSESVWLRFEHLDRAGATLFAFDAYARPSGTSDFRCLEPGPWRLAVQPGLFQGQAIELDVPAGHSVPVDLYLGQPVASGSLVIQVADSAGDVPEWKSFRDAPPVSAHVRSAGRTYSVETSAMCGNGVDAWFQRVERGGRFVLEATLEEVPLADYEITLRTRGRGFEGERSARPGTPARFLLLDSVYGLRVLDAVTKVPVPGYRVFDVSRRPRHLLSVEPDACGVHARDVDLFDIGQWCVVAPGYRRAYGSWEDFDRGPAGAWATVELERGWGLVVIARKGQNEWAAGVEVRFAGASTEVGRDGRALLVAPSMPADPRIGFEGWEVSSGDVDADGRFDPALHVLRVDLRRSE